MLQLSVKQYIDRTISMVNELRGKNQLLENSSDEITQRNNDLIVTLAGVIDLRDPFTLGHSQYVARYSVLIAIKPVLPMEGIELIRNTGLLHDIGKICIPVCNPDDTLPINEEGLKIIQQHIVRGKDILKKSHSIKHMAPIVRHHHERYDGTGYPDHIKGPDISIEEWIIASADAVEAIASNRRCWQGLELHKVIRGIKNETLVPSLTP